MIELDFITASLNNSYQRSFKQLRKEMELFSENEDSLWEVTEGVTNTSGNLCLHLCGNLKHFIGAILGNTGYERNRPAEFSVIGHSVEELIQMINETEAVVIKTIKELDKDTLQSKYPFELGGISYTTLEFIIHLHAHFSYHLGQINYLRRILN
jgi:uncharacterized damage-inducible protein DinB